MRNSIGYKERNAIFARLVQVCRKPPGEEFAVYDSGYDDDVVALEMTERLNRTIAASNVAFVRKSEIGLLRPARMTAVAASKDVDALLDSIIDLSAKVFELFKRLESVERQLGAVPRQGKL